MEKLVVPTKIYSGADSLSVLGDIQNARILMVCDSFLPGTDSLNIICDQLASTNQVRLFSDIKPDPPLENIMSGVEVYQEVQPSVIIAVGGGSAIDTAKAIRFFGEKLTNQKVANFVAIPTTSGTGSEVTNTAVVSDTKNGVKFPIIKDHLIPDIAILDPTLVMSAPNSVTAFSGLDVLTHALESLVANDANLYTDALAEKSIQVIIAHLVETYQHGTDFDLRHKIHDASCAAGLAFNTAGLGICHSLAHQIGAKFHVPHGLANAMLLPYVVEFNARDKQVAAKYAAAIGKTDLASASFSSNDQVLIKRLQKQIFTMMKAMKCPKTLKEFGISESDVRENMEWIVSHAREDGTFPGNPVVPTNQELAHIVESIIK